MNQEKEFKLQEIQPMLHNHEINWNFKIKLVTVMCVT